MYTPNAATIPDPHQLVGKQLEPIIEILASQPINLQTHLINKSTLMLEQLANIRQRRESHRRFAKLVIDLTTKEARKDKNGQPIKFVPNSARNNNPIHSSAKYKDDTRMFASDKANELSNQRRIAEVTAQAKARSRSEITVREEDLKRFFQPSTRRCQSVVYQYYKEGIFPARGGCDSDES